MNLVDLFGFARNGKFIWYIFDYNDFVEISSWVSSVPPVSLIFLDKLKLN
jgi:hypothetical protein